LRQASSGSSPEALQREKHLLVLALRGEENTIDDRPAVHANLVDASLQVPSGTKAIPANVDHRRND
jgi:hypothetical protein